MRDVEVTARVPADDEKKTPELQATVTVKFPDTFEEAKGFCGEEPILSNAQSNYVITIQSNIRNGLKRGESPEAIAARLKDSKPGVTNRGATVDVQQAFIAKFTAATPEERRKMLATLQTAAAAKA